MSDRELLERLAGQVDRLTKLIEGNLPLIKAVVGNELLTARLKQDGKDLAEQSAALAKGTTAFRQWKQQRRAR